MDGGLRHCVGLAALFALPSQQFLLVEAGLVDHGGALVELGLLVLPVDELLNAAVGLCVADLDLEDLIVELALRLLVDDILERVSPLSDPQDLLDLGHPAEIGVALIANTVAYLLKASALLLERFEFEPRMVGFGPNDRLWLLGVVFLPIFACRRVEQAGSVLLDGSRLFYESFLVLKDDDLPLIHDFSLIVLIFAGLGGV